MSALLPKLLELRLATGSAEIRKVVVLVHGILSSHETFASLVAAMTDDESLDDFHIAAFDYDWAQPILNSAKQLRDSLRARFPSPNYEVTLVGHSMGGLVGRFALIADDLPSVRRIIMLGTPNFGALTAAQQGALWQVAVVATGKLTPFFARKRGLRDLTRVQTIYRGVTDGNPSAPSRADRVDYITIPGLYYHREREDLDAGNNLNALPFMGGALVLAVLSVFRPSEIRIEKPHDGVVEESSVSMLEPKAGGFSEKSLSIQRPSPNNRTYAHITPITALDQTHMKIQSDKSVISVIKGVLRFEHVVKWDEALCDDERRTFISVQIP